MPLTNNVIIKLNEITALVENKGKLKPEEVDEIKTIFQDVLQNGEMYDIDDIESWLENEGSWPDKPTRIRITNISHYVQDKHQQTARLRIMSDNDSCGCEN